MPYGTWQKGIKMAEVEIAGAKIKGGKMLLLLPILGTLGGGLWGGFEFYKDYMNMREKIEPVKHIIDIASQAMITTGIKPKIKAIRGGTDGARLSFMGLPCPNIFAGGHNFHGRYEFVPLESMEKAVEVIVTIVDLVAQKNRQH